MKQIPAKAFERESAINAKCWIILASFISEKKCVELNVERHFSHNSIQPPFSPEIAAVLVLRKINADVEVSNS